MCGIFGVIGFAGNKDKKQLINDLLSVSCRRGTDAAGVCVFDNKNVQLLKRQGSGNKLRKILPNMDEAALVVGQTRLATNGDPSDKNNNQPIRVGNLWLVHNGIVVNSLELAKKYRINNSDSDTRVLAKVIRHKMLKKSAIKSIESVSGEITGTINLALVTKHGGNYLLNLVSNNGSLYIGKSDDGLIFASEKHFLEKVALKNNLKLSISQLNINSGIEIDENLNIKEYELRQSKVSDERTVLVKVPLSLKKHDLDKRIKKIKRCVKCILPTNTPNISFDRKGVCNYCRGYKKIKYDGSGKLNKLLDKYRSKDGKPDCILAFSGGRDSAYGLHFLVKEMGMHPIAITFDWGMISNIGRRNQARMLGKLGVEQIIVSADLAKVRSDIRKNLTAWLHRPDLGMVPLLMQADKVTEYYVDKIKKELGLDLVFFCRGNELEKEEFKAGYCGVVNADPKGVIHNYPVIDKVRLLLYYLKQFVLNPRYFNSSMWSSMLGYMVTYVVPHDYAYLWHYVRWNEKKIISLLRKEYGWEDDGEIGITWRIDDGSPAFYNYLYGQIQGFTENDSFRSNQVREGIISRQKALKLVSQENKPRYAAMAWYFEKIGLNGHKVLDIIDRVEKKY